MYRPLLGAAMQLGSYQQSNTPQRKQHQRELPHLNAQVEAEQDAEQLPGWESQLEQIGSKPETVGQAKYDPRRRPPDRDGE